MAVLFQNVGRVGADGHARGYDPGSEEAIKYAATEHR
jgi:hypothetical protein